MLRGSDFLPTPGARRAAARDALRAEPDRLPPSRPRLLGPVRLRGGAALGRALPAADRGHRPDPLPARVRAGRSWRTCAGSACAGTARSGASRRISPLYEGALRRLKELGVIYPCFCTRKQIQAEIEEADRAPHGPSGEALYPGTCRRLTEAERQAADRGRRALRAAPRRRRRRWPSPGRSPGPTCAAARSRPSRSLLGDVVLARKDVPTSYHLAVTVDDHLQGVTLVTRGEDLFHATHVHRLLQALLGLRTPRYYHHNLIADSTRPAPRQAQPGGDDPSPARARLDARPHLAGDRAGPAGDGGGRLRP